MITRFGEIQEFQKEMNLKRKSTTLDQIQYVSADWTNANFGEKGGCAVLLNNKRKEANPKCADLIEVGCGDHSANLICKNLRINMQDLLPGFSLNGFGYLKNLHKSLCGIKKSIFKGFLASEHPNVKINLGRLSDNRYGSYYMFADRVLKNIDVFKCFFEKVSISNFFDKKEFLGEQCQAELVYMSKCALFLKQYMAQVDKVRSVGEFSAENKSWVEKMEGVLKGKQEFLDFWSVESNRKDMEELFDKHVRSIGDYLEAIKKLEINTQKTRFTLQKDKKISFFYSTLKDVKESKKATYICFCLAVELSCEIVYCLSKRNRKLEGVDASQRIQGGTNRSGERVNAQIRKLLERNPNTNRATIESVLKVNRMLPTHQLIVSAKNRFSGRKWWESTLKKIKGLSRKRLEKNKAITFLKLLFENKLAKLSAELEKEEVRDLAGQVLEVLGAKEQHPTQAESQKELLTGEDSEYKGSSLSADEIDKLQDLEKDNILVENLKTSILFLGGDYTKDDNKNLLVGKFIKQAKQFLERPVIAPPPQREELLSEDEIVRRNIRSFLELDGKELDDCFENFHKNRKRTRESLNKILNPTSKTDFLDALDNKGRLRKQLKERAEKLKSSKNRPQKK